MTFTQQQFLGATIGRFNASIGWGRSESTLSVNLVEDPVQNDKFSPPMVGSPVYFRYDSWEFGGLLQSWVERKSSSGFEFIVTVVDPRSLLGGVQMILSGYNGGVYGVPNLYNIYGYLESVRGFGGSELDETGTPWLLIKDALYALQESYPIMFGGHAFKVVFVNGPSLPAYFRINGATLSILDYVDQICDVSSCDYHVTLQYDGTAHYIYIHFISRAYIPTLGSVYGFIDSIKATTTEAGLELRNETTSKFLIGGPVESIVRVDDYINEDEYSYKSSYFENGKEIHWNIPELYYANVFNPDPLDDTIIPYWGRYATTDQPIVGKYDLSAEYIYYYADYGDGLRAYINPFYVPHRFTLDLASLGLTKMAMPYRLPTKEAERDEWLRNSYGPGCPYETDVMEMRAVLVSQEAWETFLLTYGNKEYLDQHYSVTMDDGTLEPGKETLHSRFGLRNPHFKKVVKINSVLEVNFTKLRRLLLSGTLRPEELRGSYRTYRLEADKEDPESPEFQLNKLYNYLHTFATEYFGRKFMVKIPDVYVKKIYDGPGDENDVLHTSLEVSDGGFLDESLWPNAIKNGYLPFDVNKFTLEDNRISAYVRFAFAYREAYNPLTQESKPGWFYDTKELNEDDYTFWNNALYVKCAVDPKIVFLEDDYTNARVVITLPARVTQLLTKSLQMGFVKLLMMDACNATAEELAKMFGDASASVNYEFYPGMPLVPYSAFIPLKSNVETYGPWYAVGAQGITEVEQDTSLVPWNYGGFAQMNLAAMARTSLSSSTVQAGETGSISFDGVPTIPIGSVLVNGGPYVTDVSVDISSEGAVTTYKMNTWSYQYGKGEKTLEERFKKTNTENVRRDRETRDLYKKMKNITSKSLAASTLGTDNLPARLVPHTISPMMIGQVFGSGAVSEVFAANSKDITTTMHMNYNQKAGGGMDILFRPFSTASGINVDGFNGPHFTVATSGTITSQTLNPFTGQNDFTSIVAGSALPEYGVGKIENITDFARPIGLRSPLVLVGWGYDINGKPVPNSNPANPGSSFVADHKQRSDLWKAGPLDARWDESRGVWVAGGNSIGIGKLEQSLNTNSTGGVRSASHTGTGSITYGSTITQCLNITGVTLPSGLIVIKYTADGFTYPIIAPFEWGSC